MATMSVQPFPNHVRMNTPNLIRFGAADNPEELGEPYHESSESVVSEGEQLGFVVNLVADVGENDEFPFRQLSA